MAPKRRGARAGICAGDALARDRLRLAVLLSINFLSRNGANELKKLMLTPGGRGTGPTLARDRHRLAAVLSINFLSRNSPNQLKKLMLTPGGGGRSTSRRGRKILVPQPWESLTTSWNTLS